MYVATYVAETITQFDAMAILGLGHMVNLAQLFMPCCNAAQLFMTCFQELFISFTLGWFIMLFMSTWDSFLALE